MSKDDEVRQVVGELGDLLGDLQASVDALNALLIPPAPGDDGAREAVIG